MGRRTQADLLFATPSLLSGVARLLDFYGYFDSYNTSSTPAEADFRALENDWRMVGQYLSDAINDYSASHPVPFEKEAEEPVQQCLPW